MDPRLRRHDELSHDRTAADYDRHITRAFKPLHRLGLLPWVRALNLANPQTALDEGTGTGVVAIELARVCRCVVALDHSMGMLEVARAKSTSLGRDCRTTFVRGDCHHLPFADRTFDAVTIQGMLHHHGSVNWRTALHESARVLAPGGKLYISEPCDGLNPAGRLLAWLVGCLIRLTRLIRRPARLFHRLPAQPRHAPVENEHLPIERRIRADEVLDELRSLGFALHTRFFTEIPAAVTLSETTAAHLIRAISAPLGSAHGDIIFIYATKA